MVSLTEILVTGGLGCLLYQWYTFHKLRSKLSHIPTVGSSTFIWTYFSALRFLVDGTKVLEEGYQKYGGAIFKFPTTVTKSGWMIIVNDDKLIDELRKAPTDVLSFANGVKDSLMTESLLGARHAGISEYHAGVVRTTMTRALPDRFSDICEEITHASNEFLPRGQEWEAMRAHETIIHVVCRTTNRLFVGLPLCRDKDYCKIQENWTINFIVAGHIVHLAPAVLRPVVAFFSSKLLRSRTRVEGFLRPIIEQRLENDAKLGPNYEGKPNDAISWLLDAAPEGYRTVEDITARIMLINFAAIHTSSLTLTNVLFDLAARQEYIQPLREEVETVIREHGWTKEAMGHLRKADSFIKESSRLASVVPTSVVRKAMRDYTFANGIVIPEGCTVGAGASRTHVNPDIYENPDAFNGFRFVEKAENPPNQMVSIDSTFLFFGLGRNACPGRFFAVNEVKIALSHILLNYDIKLPGDSTEVPPGKWFTASRAPDPAAQILFRKRKAD